MFVLPQLVGSGLIEPGPLVGVMVVLPTPIGWVAASVGAVAGVVVLARRTRRRAWLPLLLMTIGHCATLLLVLAIVVWAFAFASTGWELITLPASLMLGQLPVALGLVWDVILRRRGVRAHVMPRDVGR
nr:hypothetical protein [Rhodococcus sp. HNM0569]